MKYQNAQSVIPEELLIELQKYVNGAYIYIPKPDKDKRNWGEKSGNRAYYEKRNSEIAVKYANGLEIYDLAGEYCLSVDSIRKILYKQKNGET